MSAQIPDPKTFESWEDAFQYPVPAVRGMEKKLRANINDNREKLRTLVGSSYRDLLGTAKTIVNADGQMHEVEDLLAVIGRRSDSRIFEKIATNQARLARSERDKHTSKYSFAVQLSLLQRILGAIRNILKLGSSSLLVAKLLVIGRNIYRVLTNREDELDILSVLQDKLRLSQRKLLRYIDRNFARATSSDADLVEDMTAFCLVTSSTATDVLRHFQDVRLRSIENLEPAAVSAPARLRQYTSTQRASRAVFPELLNASLRIAAALPLLQDQSVLNLQELDLDISLSWIADDVKNFTSNPRYSDLSSAATGQLLDTWTEEALKSLLDGIKKDVGVVSDFIILMEVRKDILQTWLSSRRYASSLRTTYILNQLRSILIERFAELVYTVFDRALSNVSDIYDKTLEEWDSRAAVPGSFWVLADGPLDLSNAAMAFRDSIKDRRRGRGSGINAVVQAFEKSWSAIHLLQGVVKQMRETRWIEDYDDDDLDEDVRPASALSKEDPQRLQSSLIRNANMLTRKLEEHLTTSSSEGLLNCSSPYSPGIFILRTIRELRYRIPPHVQQIDPSMADRFNCRGLVLRLNQSLIDSMIITLEDNVTRTLTRTLTTASRLRPIWDGNPPLPIQVSPSTVKLLRSLATQMQSFGSDLWSRGVVDALRGQLQSQFGMSLRSCLEEEEKTAPELQTNGMYETTGEDADGEEVPDETETLSQDEAVSQPGEALPSAKASDNTSEDERVKVRAEKARVGYTQLLFDVLYLENAFISSSARAASEKSNLSDGIVSLIEKSELPDASVVKMRKNAADYWRRTYLLFGLLCG